MHLALQIPDILALIFEEADVSSLIAATRCCRAFSAAALDKSWRSIDGFTPLFRILPGFQTHETSKPHLNHRILRGIVSDESWARFENYARRVRIFYNGCQGETADRIHPSVYLQLTRRCQFILPHLTYFDLNLEYFDDLTGISALLCLPSSLRKLSLSYYSPEYFSDSGYIVGAMFDQIPITAYSINHLRVDLYLPDKYLDKIILMKSLRVLKLSEMTVTPDYLWLHRLPALTNLTTLRLSVNTIPAPGGSPPLDWSGLTGLRVLMMNGTLENFAYILAALPPNQLHTLKLHAQSRQTLAQVSWPRKLWQYFHTCVSHMSRQHTLRELTLDLQTFDLQDRVTRAEMAFPPFLSIIQPILSLRSLKTAIFRAFPPVDLSSNDLSICGHSWPDIEILEFPFILSTMLSLDATNILFSMCPKLTRLGIAVERLDSSLGSGQIPWSTNLTILRIHVSISSDPDAGAAFLLQLFPKLQCLCTFVYDRDLGCLDMCNQMGTIIQGPWGERPVSPFFF